MLKRQLELNSSELSAWSESESESVASALILAFCFVNFAPIVSLHFPVLCSAIWAIRTCAIRLVTALFMTFASFCLRDNGILNMT